MGDIYPEGYTHKGHTRRETHVEGHTHEGTYTQKRHTHRWGIHTEGKYILSKTHTKGIYTWRGHIHGGEIHTEEKKQTNQVYQQIVTRRQQLQVCQQQVRVFLASITLAVFAFSLAKIVMWSSWLRKRRTRYTSRL